jgi:hypothetical protein
MSAPRSVERLSVVLLDWRGSEGITIRTALETAFLRVFGTVALAQIGRCAFSENRKCFTDKVLNEASAFVILQTASFALPLSERIACYLFG